MESTDLFSASFNEKHFENNSHENGFTYWYGSELMKWLEYENYSSFSKAINKAIAACTTLNIPIIDNFTQIITETTDGKKFNDWKLSRFACYLVVLNGDVKKKPVAMAQAYFANLAGAIHNYIEEQQKLERIIERDEVSKHEKSLHHTAYSAGVENYVFFQNAGYRGMYNMNIGDLKNYRGLSQTQSPLDFMDSVELAANKFRITQTELRIKNYQIKGQQNLEDTHEKIGKMVRKSMQEMSGTLPEYLPKKEDIKDVKKELKEKNKKLKLIDKKKKKDTK